MEQNVPKLDISKVLNYEDIAKEENQDINQVQTSDHSKKKEPDIQK